MRTSLIAISLTLGFLAGFVGLGAGCGGGGSAQGGGSLDCAYLASADNCWKTTASAATSCLPDPSETGTLSADGKTCTYASGEVVTFTPPLVLPLPTNGSANWNFTVTTASGATCLAFQDSSSGGLTLTVQGQTVKETNPGGLSVGLTCPDGTSHTNSNGLSLLNCGADGGYISLPGDSLSSTDTAVFFSLLSTGSSSFGEPVFNCQTAP
jgi:hypothetical protein